VSEIKSQACAGCGGDAVSVGPDCRVPKQTDVKGWKLLRALVEDCNWQFQSCSERHIRMKGLMPRNQKEISDFTSFVEQKKHLLKSLPASKNKRVWDNHHQLEEKRKANRSSRFSQGVYHQTKLIRTHEHMMLRAPVLAL